MSLPRNIKTIILWHEDGSAEVTDIYDNDRENVTEAYYSVAQRMIDGDNLYVQVRSKANTAADEDTKIFF